MNEIVKTVISKKRWEYILANKCFVEFKPILNSNSIFMGRINSVINNELFNRVYIDNYSKYVYGNKIQISDNEYGLKYEKAIEDKSKKIKPIDLILVNSEEIGSNVLFTLKELDTPEPFWHKSNGWILTKIELVKYSEISSRKDLVDKTSMDDKFLKSRLRAYMSGINKIKTNNNCYFWAITYEKKEKG